MTYKLRFFAEFCLALTASQTFQSLPNLMHLRCCPVSCVSSRNEVFLNMSTEGLAEYHAHLPEKDEIVCRESIRRGTVGLMRKVCISQLHMAGLTPVSNSNSGINGVNSGFGFYGNSGFSQDRTLVLQVFFSALSVLSTLYSPPPPGYRI